MLKLDVLSLSLAASLALLATAGTASAGTVYRWTTEDGSVAFADDVKRIPSQYRAGAKAVRTGDLAGYARFTPSERPKAQSDRSEAIAARIERLREINAEVEEVARADRAGPSHTILRLDDRASITIPNDRMNGDEPVVVEERRVRDRNNISTTHLTVVRQGDEILSVVRPESAHDRADWADEGELLGE